VIGSHRPVALAKRPRDNEILLACIAITAQKVFRKDGLDTGGLRPVPIRQCDAWIAADTAHFQFKTMQVFTVPRQKTRSHVGTRVALKSLDMQVDKIVVSTESRVKLRSNLLHTKQCVDELGTLSG